MAKVKDKTLTLEATLWNCRNDLRGIGTLDKNRNIIISLIFLKFCGDKFKKQREIIKQTNINSKDLDVFLEDPSFYLENNVFYLEPEARWDFIVERSSTDEIATLLDKALADIEKDNEILKGALQKNLFTSFFGSNKEQLKMLIDDVNQISEERFHEEDLIGRVYEYFLQSYAASGSKDDGEFYTPSSVVKLIAELIEPYHGIVYDPCCGSGGMFIQSMKFVEEHQGNKKGISVYGQESNDETWRLCKMNLAIRGIPNNLGPKNADTFGEDLHKDLDGMVDYVMANPPFNQTKWWKKSDEEYLKDKRWSKTKPRRSNGNYAWIKHIISKLDSTEGVAGFLLANGALGDAGDTAIREEIIKDDKVEAIIVLPRDMFYTTDISATLWIIRMDKNAGEINGRKVRDRRGEVLFMDLRTWNSNDSEITIDKNKSKKKVIFSDKQINDVKRIYDSWQSPDKEGYRDIPELCKSTKVFEKDLTNEEKENGCVSIESQGYVLMPSRYIEFVDHDLDIDYEKEMIRIQCEMKSLLEDEKNTHKMLEEAFEGMGYEII